MSEVYAHRRLVESAYKWVLKNSSCGVAFKELNSNACNGEYPDVIGFGGHGHSVLIECKVSRSDFFADKKKHFRINPEHGMGSLRFYCCPTGMLVPQDLPDGWGLLYVSPKGRCITNYWPLVPNPRYPESKMDYRHDKNMKAEHGLMYSALRRLHLRGLIDVIYEPPIT